MRNSAVYYSRRVLLIFGFLTRSDTKKLASLQRLARVLKFRIYRNGPKFSDG